MDLPISHLMQKAKLKLNTLSHPVRQQIINTISKNSKMSVTDIQFELRISQSATSQHLSQLRKAGYLHVETIGKNRYYELIKDKLDRDVELIRTLVN